MNVLHVTAPAQFGGLERVVTGLARQTVARGHKVVVAVVLSPNAPVPAWSTELEKAGVVMVPIHLHPRAYLAERRAIRALIVQHGIDVVHTHGYRSDFLHLGVARRLGVPIISTAHGFASKTPGYSAYERLQVWAWRRFSAVVAVSEPLRALLASFGVPPARLHCIRNAATGGSEPLPVAEARQKLALPRSGVVLGWVGRLSEEKDPLLAIEALAQLGGAGATLCIIGDGPLRTQCAERAEALGLAPRVVFAGAQPDAAPLLSAFDLLVLSSRTEGTPMVVLEAAAAGIPMVATAVGGVPDLVGDAGGWLVPPGDATALAGALREAVGNAPERVRRGGVLRASVAARSAGNDWITQYLALYSRL